MPSLWLAVEVLMGVFAVFWWLLCAHAVTDYVLQTDMMAHRKRPTCSLTDEYGPWWWWMFAHGLVNALGVLYVTQNVWLSMGECLAHMSLDVAKSQGWISTGADQLGHVVSKLLWAALA